GREGRGLRRESDTGAAHNIVQTTVRKNDFIPGHGIGKTLAFAIALGTTNLEDIREVGVKLKLQGDADALQSIIQQPEILVASGFAKELQTEQVESAAREFTRSAQVGVDIGEIHGKKGVVLANCGAQEQRLLMVQAESKARKVARLGVKQAEVG